MKDKRKLYVVRKYIKANSVHEALKKEKTAKVDEVWVDEEWKKNHNDHLESAIGFDCDDGQDFYGEQIRQKLST